MWSIKSIPAVAMMVALGLAATFISGLIVVGGKNPVEATALAVLLGIIVRNSYTFPESVLGGIKLTDKILIVGIVLLGASLNFHEVISQGTQILIIIVVTMLAGYFSILFISRKFGLPNGLSTLLAVGTTICGGTAIAVTAPLIKAREDETSYAVATITLWGVVAILLYPQIALYLGVSDNAFGIFAGTAIHSTPQVVGAGFIFSDAAGKTATAVKLVRNCFMAPLAFYISFSYARAHHEHVDGKTIKFAKAFPWFLFGYFIMAGLNTEGYLSSLFVQKATDIGKFLILISMAGVGLGTSLKSFRSLGFKPLFIGLVGTLIVGTLSIILIRNLL